MSLFAGSSETVSARVLVLLALFLESVASFSLPISLGVGVGEVFLGDQNHCGEEELHIGLEG